MSFAIIRGMSGRRHEVDFGEGEIKVSVHASAESVNLAMESDEPNRPSHKRHVALVNLPRHLFSKQWPPRTPGSGEGSLRAARTCGILTWTLDRLGGKRTVAMVWTNAQNARKADLLN